jgi:hypothetical protein
MFEHRAEVIAVIEAVMALMIYLRGRYAMDANWNKEDHPRQEDGRFGEGAGEVKERKTSAEEKQRKIDSIKIDPSKEVNELPRLNPETLEALGAKTDKPVILRKRVLEKNRVSHPDVTPEEYNQIIGNSLYRHEAVLPAHENRPYFNLISRVGEGKNTIVLLDVEDTKEGFEIVNWHWIGDDGRQRKERKAGRIGQG